MRTTSLFLVTMLVGLAACGGESTGTHDGSGGSTDTVTSTDATSGTGGNGGGFATTDTGAGGNGVGGSGTTGAGGAGTTAAATTGAGGNGGAGGGNVASCLDAKDCSNNGSAVCDPKTQECGAVECTVANPTCANPDDVCLIQFPNSNNGACYSSCTPFSGTCGAAQECVDLYGDGLDGACQSIGQHALGQPCTSHDTSTDCAIGNVCADQGNGEECLQQCDYWNDSASCASASQACYVMGLCLDSADVDSVPVGGACSAGVLEGNPCGQVGDKVGGYCIDTGNGYFECRPPCRRILGDDDCAAGETCHGLDVTFGVCFAP